MDDPLLPRFFAANYDIADRFDRIWSELGEFWRAGVRLAKGEGYATSYVLLLPGGVCALWMLLAILTQATKPSYVDPGGIDEEELREAAARVCGQALVMISDIFNEREHGPSQIDAVRELAGLIAKPNV